VEIETFWRLPEVERRTGLRRAYIYQQARLGNFPRPLKIGVRASAWRASEIVGWIESRIAAAGSSKDESRKGQGTQRESHGGRRGDYAARQSNKADGAERGTDD